MWDIFAARAEGDAYAPGTFDHAHNKHLEFFFPAWVRDTGGTHLDSDTAPMERSACHDGGTV